MKRRIFTFFVAFVALCFLGSKVTAQTTTTTNPVLTGVTYYNIIYTTGGVDYYATFDPVSYDLSFSPLVPGSNAQALTFAFQTTDGTWGNCFNIYSLSNADNFLSENANWKSATYAGTTIPNAATIDSWKKFYFVKDNVTGLYAIRPNANNDGKCWTVPALSTNNKIGVSAYFTTETRGTSPIPIPAQGDASYCFKIQQATVVDQKPALTDLYNSCLSLYNSSVEGTAVGNYATGSLADFKGKIDAANVVIVNASATADQIGAAYGPLETSLVWFRNKVVTNNHLLGDGYYSICTKNPDGTKYYLTDKDPHTDATAAVQPVDYELAATGDALKYQQFKVSWDATASRYKIEGRYRLDNSYTHAQVNQDFSFDFGAYSTTINTFNIYSDGSVAALKRVDSKGYIRPYTTSPGTATAVSTPANVGAVTYSFSNAAAINTFMGNSLIYNFEVVLTAATQVELDALQAQITAANALLTSTTEGTAPGQYTTANRSVLSVAIASATTVYNTANAFETNVTSTTSSLATVITTYSNSVNVSTTALADGNYYIFATDGTTNYYLTDEAPHTDPVINTSIPLGYELLGAADADKAYQIFTLTFDNTKGRYKIEGKYRLDNAYGKSYVNEGAKFGGNVYSSDWNTMSITYNGTRYAILSGGSASINYWGPASLTAGAVTSLTASSGALLSAHLVYNFTPVSGTPTSVASTNERGVAAYGVENAIKLSGTINKVLVYNVAGQLVKSVVGNVNLINVPKGQYLVKIISETTTKVEKVVVR